MMTSMCGVYLTGNTLSASLKMRSDTSGAGYCIYWLKVGDEMVVADQYVSPARRQELLASGKTSSYAEASEGVKLDAKGDGPVATVYRTGKPVFVPNAAEELKLKRREFAKEYGIKSMCFIPFEDGVLEYGASIGDSTAVWSKMPECPTMPKKEMRKAFENIGAKYVMFWSNASGDGYFRAIATYVTPERVRALANKRGDNKTFCSESQGFKLPVDGNGPVATAARTGQEQFIQDAPTEPTFRRKDIAKEFGVASIHFVPVTGGVLEYGTPKGVKLSGNPLAAAMKMRCDNSGAVYAIYWTKYDNQYVVAADYTTPERCSQLKEAGLEGSFAESSKGVHLPADGDGPVATVGKTDKPYYISDAQNCPLLKRKDFAKKYGISSIAFVPIEGGVLEYGTTLDWGPEMPPCPDMPKDELKTAFNSGAVSCIFWQRRGDFFEVAADYVVPERAFALEQKRGDKKTFASESRKFKLPADGSGYVATAARSGKAFTIADAKSDPKLLRHEIAKEFNMGEVHVVPCKDGVLEYGVAPTKA